GADEAIDLFAVGNVANYGKHAGAARDEVGGGAVQLLVVAGADGQIRTLLGELARPHQAEAARAAGDEDRPAPETVRRAAAPQGSGGKEGTGADAREQQGALHRIGHGSASSWWSDSFKDHNEASGVPPPSPAETALV